MQPVSSQADRGLDGHDVGEQRHESMLELAWSLGRCCPRVPVMARATIRPARLSDASEIAQLTTQLGYDLTEADAADRLSRLLLRDDQRFFVADVDGRAVGWVHVLFVEYVDAEAFVVIGGLVVDRNHRRLGVGRALMKRAEVWAGERGCAMVRLTSSATRAAAHRFYEALGYTNIKTQYSFVKPLNPAAAARVRSFVPRLDSGT
jgi:GNAT superfamily N-acetyltransferase